MFALRTIRRFPDTCTEIGWSEPEPSDIVYEVGSEGLKEHSQAFGAGGTVGGARYELKEVRDDVGNTTVAHAFDNISSREVALLIAKQRGERSTAAHKLELTARAAQKLTDCYEIPSLHDLGLHDGHAYLVMQWIGGGTLRETLTNSNTCLEPERVRQLAMQLSRALGAIHSAGMIHRSVCPENILLDDFGNHFLWGLSSCTGSDPDTRDPKPLFPLVNRPYAAPELLLDNTDARNIAADHRADIYALGVILIEALVGTKQLGERGPAGAVQDLQESRLGPTENPATVRLGEIAARLINNDPDQRPGSAKAVMLALDDVLAETRLDIKSLILLGETNEVEFKSSLRYAHNPGVPEEHKFSHSAELESAVLKAVASFANGKGGTLLIGVEDSGEVPGIEYDFESFTKGKNRDEWHRHLVGLMDERLEPRKSVMTFDISFDEYENALVAAIRVPRSSEAVWLADKSGEKRFFVRNGPRTLELTGSEISDYIMDRLASRMQDGSVRL